MKRFLNQIRVEWLIAAFCAWHSADLIHAWRHSPYDRWGWLALLVWLIPALNVILRGTDTGRHFKLAVVSLTLTLIGVIGDLNALVYCGLAGVIGALANVAGRGWIWLVLAVCWMPAFGYGCERLHFSTSMVPILRLTLAALAAAFGLCWLVPARVKMSA